MKASEVQTVKFENYRISLEEVMEQFDESGKEMYEEIVDELLEDAQDHVKPEGRWKEIPVTFKSEEKVQLENTTFQSAYLARKLKGVDTVYAFTVTIGDELWNCRENASDPLEQYLFDAIMNTSLNLAFARTAEEIVLNFPDKVGIYMDNPGHLAGWDLSDQKVFLKILENEESWAKVNDRDLFENSYSLSGIIYPKGTVPANCVLCPKPDCTHRKDAFDGKALTAHLHESSGKEEI